MSLSTTSRWFLNTFRDGDSTTYLGSLFQCLTTLSVKKFFLISNLNLPWLNLRPFHLVLSPVTSEKRPTSFLLYTPFRYWRRAIRSPLNLLFPQIKQPQFLQSLLIGHILQALHKPCCPPLDLLQHLNVLSVPRCPKLTVSFEGSQY